MPIDRQNVDAVLQVSVSSNVELFKSVGVLEQYPDYEDWDEDDEF